MADIRTALAAALGPLYRVEREVRPVDEYRLFVATLIPDGPGLLVKVLPTALSLSIDADRFARDLVLLADRLHHPHLVAPKGAGRAGPFVYYTRLFVDGTTLHAWMANNGPVPLARAVDIIRGVLSGLAHAHGAGITHGDLRAEHVLLAVDGILLADVGIAATLGHRTTPRDDMAALVALVQEMLTSGLGSDGEEKLETSRSLPPWLTDWLRTRWTDAGKALAAIQLPPSPPHSGPRAPQPFV